MGLVVVFAVVTNKIHLSGTVIVKMRTPINITSIKVPQRKKIVTADNLIFIIFFRSDISV